MARLFKSLRKALDRKSLRRLASGQTAKIPSSGIYYRPWLEPLEDRTLITAPPVNFAALQQIVLAPGSTASAITAPAVGSTNLFYEFAASGDGSQTATFEIDPAQPGDVATVGLYDSTGNYLGPFHSNPHYAQPQPEFSRNIGAGQVYILGVFLNANQASDPFTLTTTLSGETEQPAVNLDLTTGRSPAVSDAFATPASVNFYPLNLLDGGSSGTLTVTPTGVGTMPFATIFRRVSAGDPWQPLTSNSGSSAFTLPLTPAANANLTDAQYLVGAAPAGFNTAARAYTLQAQATLLAPAGISGPVTDLMTPAPTMVGTAQINVPNGNLTAGGQRLYSFRAPADGTTVIGLQSAAFDPLLSIYDASGANLLAAASSTVPGTASANLSVNAGTVYEVRVGDVANLIAGAFQLTITAPYAPTMPILNPLTANVNVPGLRSSVTETQISVGPAQGAHFYRLNLSPGAQILVVGIDPGTGQNPVAPHVVLLGPDLLPITPQVSGGKIYLPVDISSHNGPFDLFVEGTSGSDPATLQIGQLQLPSVLTTNALPSQFMDLSGKLASAGKNAGAFGALIGLKYQQLAQAESLGNTLSPTTLAVQGQGGAQPLLVHYAGQGSALNLADYKLPDSAAAAQLQDGLPNSQIEGVAAISLRAPN